MSIKYAILGMLRQKPSTGYELKKIFETSSFMYWSGNNNQIYKSLIQLQNEELVTSKIIHQDSSPSKKIYTITAEGQSKLKGWLISDPEVPEFKKPFLIQFAHADLLNSHEILDLVARYENELKLQLLLQEEKAQRDHNSSSRSVRGVFLNDMISQNIISSYKNELDWVQEVRQKLDENPIVDEGNKMEYKIIETNNKKYLELISAQSSLNTENDALELVALCGENDTNLIMLNHSTLSKDFFKLKTGVAGQILQKFINYHVKVAALIPDEISQKGKFKQMAVETNKSNHFRIFEEKEQAQKWLLK